MSPELKKQHQAKQRRMAFYIVENEIKNEENPPEISAIIGLDRELEAAFYAARKPLFEKNSAIRAGIRINRSITSNKKSPKKPQARGNEIHCPSPPTQWKNNMDYIMPKAEFGFFTTTTKKRIAK